MYLQYLMKLLLDVHVDKIKCRKPLLVNLYYEQNKMLFIQYLPVCLYFNVGVTIYPYLPTHLHTYTILEFLDVPGYNRYLVDDDDIQIKTHGAKGHRDILSSNGMIV